MLDAVGRQKLVEEAAGKSTRQVKRMLADLDPELAAPADRVRPLGNGRYELKALIDAECQRGLEQLAGLLSHVDPRYDGGTARRPASAGGARPPRPEPAAPAHRQSAGSQRHFDGTDPAGLRRPRRSGAEVTRFGPIQASHYGHARMDSRALCDLITMTGQRSRHGKSD